MQADIEQNAHRAPQQVHALEKPFLFRAVKPLFAHHVFAIERPALDGERRPHVLAGIRGVLLRVHQLEMVAGETLV